MLLQTYGAAEGELTASVFQKHGKMSPNAHLKIVMYPSLNKSPHILVAPFQFLWLRRNSISHALLEHSRLLAVL